eukprot:776673_1
MSFSQGERVADNRYSVGSTKSELPAAKLRKIEVTLQKYGLSSWRSKCVNTTRAREHIGRLNARVHTKDIRSKARELFWCHLKSEVYKVNTFYKVQEAKCLEFFKKFNFQTFISNAKGEGESSVAICEFVRSVRNSCPAAIAQLKLYDYIVEKSCCPPHFGDDPVPSEISGFIELWKEVRKLLKFASINQEFCCLLVSEYDEQSSQ